MADQQEAMDPDDVVTEGELIAVIVISVLIVILLVIQIALLIYCFCRRRCAQRCPCCAKEKDILPGERYGEDRVSRRSDEEHLIREETYITENGEKPLVDDLNEFKPTPHDKDERKKKKKKKKKDGDDDEKDPDDKDNKGVRGDPEVAARTLEQIITPGADEEEQPKVREGPGDTDPRGKETDKPRGREGQGSDTDIKPIPDETPTPGRDKDSDPRVKPGPPDTDPRRSDAEEPGERDGKEGHTDITPVITLIPGTKEDDDPRVRPGPSDTVPLGRDVKDPEGKEGEEGHIDIIQLTPEGGDDIKPKVSSGPADTIPRGKDDLRDERHIEGSDDEKKRNKKNGWTDDKEDTSSSRSADDIRRSQVHMTLPGQPTGEDVLIVDGDGDIRGRGRRIRRPISEYSQGLPSNLPRFSLPPFGVIDTWKDDRGDDSQEKSKHKWTTLELSPEEDQGYSDGSRRKGSNEDGASSTGSAGREPRDGSTGERPGLKNTQKKKGKEDQDHSKGSAEDDGEKKSDHGEDPTKTGVSKKRSKQKDKDAKESTIKRDNGDDTGTTPRSNDGKMERTPSDEGGEGTSGNKERNRGQKMRVQNDDDSGIGDFGHVDEGFYTDGKLKGRGIRIPGEYFVDDDDVSIGDDTWKYWPDGVGRFRGMDQWDSDDAGMILDDLELEDVEFDDSNQLMRTGESFGSFNNPENDKTLGSKVKDQDNKQKSDRGKHGKDSPSQQKEKGKDRNTVDKTGSNGLDDVLGDCSTDSEAMQDGTANTKQRPSKLGRPPIKDGPSTSRNKGGPNTFDKDHPDEKKKKHRSLRLGRGLPTDAVIEEDLNEEDTEPILLTKNTKGTKQKQGTGKRPEAAKNDHDGGKDDNTQDDDNQGSDILGNGDNKETSSGATKPTGGWGRGTSRKRAEHGAGRPDEGTSGSDGGDPMGGEKVEGTSGPVRIKGKRRRPRRKKTSKSHRGPKGENETSWDAYLEHDTSCGLLNLIFMESDDDYR